MLTVPNNGSAAVLSGYQSELDEIDFQILSDGLASTYVISGCAVTAQGSPDMTTAVAVGSVKVGGTTVAVSAGNVTITAAHATLNRFDLVVANSSGTKSVLAGTAATAPVFPTYTAGTYVVLASVYIPANDTTISSQQIVDKRVIRLANDRPLFISNTTTSSAIANTTTATDFNQVLTIPGGTLRAGDMFEVVHTAKYAADLAATIFWRAKIGSSEYSDQGVTAVISGEHRISLRALWLVDSIGASGVLTLVMAVLAHGSTYHATATYTIDTTANIVFTPRWQWSAASAGNSAVVDVQALIIHGVSL